MGLVFLAFAFAASYWLVGVLGARGRATRLSLTFLLWPGTFVVVATPFGGGLSFFLGFFLFFLVSLPAAALVHAIDFYVSRGAEPSGSKRQAARFGASHGFCPNCDAEIPLESQECVHCGALFGANAAWCVRPKASGGDSPEMSVDGTCRHQV